MVFSQRFWVGKGVFYIKMAWSGKRATCSCLPKCFSFLSWSKSTCRIADTYKKWSFFSVFGRCGLFPQDFGQVQGHIILCLIKIKRVCFIVLCRILLVFFGIEGDMEECTNLRKMVNSKYFLPSGSFSSSFWAGWGMVYIRITWNDKIPICSCILSCF